MYKTFYELNVYIKGVEHPYDFLDDENYSSGTAALMQVKAGRNIDVVASFGGVQNNVIIPYHAIEYVVVSPDRQEGPDPVDDNCNTGDPTEPGTLKIVNSAGKNLADTEIQASGTLAGVYGDLTFEPAPEPDPDYGAYSTATVAFMADGDTVTATGLPDGTYIDISSDAGSYHGTVPCTITLGGSQPGPK